MTTESTQSGFVFLTGASRFESHGRDSMTWANAFTLATFSRTTTPELSALNSQYGDKVLILAGDIADPTASTHALRAALSHFGNAPLKALVLNAAVQAISVIARAELADWRRAFDVNFFGALPLVQAALPALRAAHGRVVFVSASAAVLPIQGMAGYSASKAALNAFAATLAVEETAIPVVAVDPGLVETSMSAEAAVKGADHFAPSMREFAQKAFESGVVQQPDAPGRVIAWFALHAPQELSGKYLPWEEAAKIARTD
ncbi:NAD(P)-binding protein [Auricularia subglabra TFB-10046 SS5]|nr:NAD(P)-binding protein [Auricularia subglabra TFB-10046 SS5]